MNCKKRFFLLLISILLMAILPVKAATCDYSEKAKLKAEASTVEVKYEVVEIETDDNIEGVIQEFDDETGKITGYGLRVNVLNLNEDLSAQITDNISPDVIEAKYDANTNGKFVKDYGVNDVEYVRTLNVTIKASENTSCEGENLRIVTLVLPRFNHYSYNDSCVEHPEFSLCQSFTTMSEISYKTFQKELNNYINGVKEEETKNEEKEFQDTVASSIKMALYVVGGGIIALGIVMTIYHKRKPSKKRGQRKKNLSILLFLLLAILPFTVRAEEPQYTIYGTVMHTNYSSYHLSGYTGEKRLRNILKYDATGEGKNHFAVCINPGLHSVKQVFKVADPANDSRTSEFYAEYNNSIIEMFSYAESTLGYNLNSLSNDQYVSLAQAIRTLSTGAFNNVKAAYDAASEDCHEAFDVDACKIYKVGQTATEQIETDEVSIDEGEVNKRVVIHKINNYKKIKRIGVDNSNYIVDYSCDKTFKNSKTNITDLKCSGKDAYIRLKYTLDSCDSSNTKYTISYEFRKNTKTISYLSTKSSTAASTQKYIFYDESNDLTIKKVSNNPKIDCPKYRCQIDEEGNYYDWDYNKITGSNIEEIIEKFKKLCGCRIVTEVTPHLYYDNEGNLIDLGSDETNYEQWKKVCDSGENDCTNKPGCCIDGEVTYYDGKPVSMSDYKQLCNPDSCIYQQGCCIEDGEHYYDGSKVTEKEYESLCDNPSKHYCEYDAESGYYYLADGTRTKLKSDYLNSCSCTEANNGVYYGSMGTDGNFSQYSSSSDPGFKEECSCVVLPGDNYRDEEGKPVTFEEFSKKCCGPSINGSNTCVNIETDENNMINVFDFKEVANNNVVKCVLNNKDIAGNSYKLAKDHEPDSTTLPKASNKYCAVYCKEDYEYLKFTGRQDAYSGRYITLNAASKGTKTCYLGRGAYNDNTNRVEPDGVNIEGFNEIVGQYYEKLVKELNRYYESKAYFDALSDAKAIHRKISSCVGDLNIVEYNVAGAKNGVKYPVYKLITGNKQGHYVDYQIVVDSEKQTFALTFEDTYSLATYDKQTNTCNGSNTVSDTAEEKLYASKKNYEQSYKNANEQIKKLLDNIRTEVNEINECTNWSVKGLDALLIKFEYEDIYFERFFNKADRNVFNVTSVSEEKSNPVEACTGSLTDNSYESCGSNPVEVSSKIHKYEWDGSELKDIGEKYTVSNVRYRSEKYVDAYTYATKNVVYNTFPSGVITDEETTNSSIIEGLPIQIKVPTGIYDFKYKVEKIGEIYENKYLSDINKHDTGRIIDNTVENANTVVNKILNNSDKVLFNGEYVCQYIINCPQCDVTCDDDGCSITPHCPICMVDCDDCCVGCIYDDGDLQIDFKSIAINPPKNETSNPDNPNGDEQQDCNILGCDLSSAPYNWNVESEYEILAKKADATIKEISEYGELIYLDKEDSEVTELTGIGSSQKVLKVVMTPSLASKIRDYNREKNNKGGFSDDSLKCYDYKIGDRTFENIFCYSEFIDKFESDFEYINESRISSSDKNQRESASKQINNSQNDYWKTFINVTGYEINVEKIGSQKVLGGPAWK